MTSTARELSNNETLLSHAVLNLLDKQNSRIIIAHLRCRYVADSQPTRGERLENHSRNNEEAFPWANVRVADTGGYSDAPIFDDLKDCKLPAISWVIPDALWSDHAEEAGPLGPSFVGDIVDAVGGGMANSTCNPPSTTNAKYWKQEPTAIFIVWDDWGGWFDHVQPWKVYENTADPTKCPSGAAPNGWGCGYTSGFRVPLLVVSEYTPPHYVSGALPSPGMDPTHTHDFGSILAFTEHNFGLPFIDGPPVSGYADYNAPDWSANHSTHVPLSDFFGSSQYSFTSIQTSEPYTCFQDFTTCLGVPFVASGPDGEPD